MWKKIATGIIILLLLIAAGGYYFFTNLDSIVKTAIEKYGSEATGTQVKVQNVSLSLTSGTGSISGLTIANPPGYSAPHALSISKITLKLDISSLAGKGPIIIDALTVEQPQAAFEIQGLSPVSNLETIESNIKAFNGSSAATQPSAQGGTMARGEIVRNFSITGGQLTASAPALAHKTLTEKIPPMQLANLGGKYGATPVQLGTEILHLILAQAAYAGAYSVAQTLGSGPLPANAGALVNGLFGH